MRINDPKNPGTKVATVIGGNVAKNINNPAPSQRWSNTCAVRLSYILNQSGMPIPHIPGQTVSGADKRWYFFRVKDVIAFLKQQWGQPDSILQYPPAGGGVLSAQKGPSYSRSPGGQMRLVTQHFGTVAVVMTIAILMSRA